MHVFSISVYSPLYSTTNTMKSRLFSEACVKYDHPWSIWNLDAFFSLTFIFALFPWTNVMQLSKQSLVRWRRFHDYHHPDGNTHIKNDGSFKKYLKFTLTFHINPNSYPFRIMFIMIIGRFFIICFINGWKYEKVATNWDKFINWCVYHTLFFYLR